MDILVFVGVSFAPTMYLMMMTLHALGMSSYNAHKVSLYTASAVILGHVHLENVFPLFWGHTIPSSSLVFVRAMRAWTVYLTVHNIDNAKRMPPLAVCRLLMEALAFFWADKRPSPPHPYIYILLWAAACDAVQWLEYAACAVEIVWIDTFKTRFYLVHTLIVCLRRWCMLVSMFFGVLKWVWVVWMCIVLSTDGFLTQVLGALCILVFQAIDTFGWWLPHVRTIFNASARAPIHPT